MPPKPKPPKGKEVASASAIENMKNKIKGGARSNQGGIVQQDDQREKSFVKDLDRSKVESERKRPDQSDVESQRKEPKKKDSSFVAVAPTPGGDELKS